MAQDMTGKNDIVYLTEEELRKYVIKAIGRTFHRIIDTFESHHEDTIPIEWIRDYIDDVIETFPRIVPEDIKKDKYKSDV